VLMVQEELRSEFHLGCVTPRGPVLNAFA
jgi:hypothetical protein